MVLSKKLFGQRFMYTIAEKPCKTKAIKNK